jgi:hypothetical protein
VTNIEYALGSGATGAVASGLPTGVSGSVLGSTFVLSGTPTVSGVFNYTITTTGGCSPAASISGTISVTPQNTIASGTNQTVCINTAITNIILSTTGATGATFTGLPAGVQGIWAANTFTISGTPTESGTFNYTVTTTGGCPPATTSGTITVTPQNTIAAGTSQTVCINTAITKSFCQQQVLLVPHLVVYLLVLKEFGEQTLLRLVEHQLFSGVFNYTVTTTGGCPPATATGTITVTPQNTIAAGTSQTVCINSSIYFN